MEEAIRNAELEASRAAAAHAKAQSQLEEWTNEEKAVIKQLKSLQKVIDSPDFAAVTTNFVNEHKHVFDFAEENRFEYSVLHEQYVELMEKTLTEMASDVNMDELVAGLPDFVQAKAHAKDPEQTGSTIDFLLSITEFDSFKSLMLAAKMADEGTSASISLDADDGSQGLLNALADLHIEPKVQEHARVLLKLSGAESGVEWKHVAQKKGSWLLEQGEVGGKTFMRSTGVIQLNVEHTIKAHCDLSDPRCCEWELNWGAVKLLSQGKSSDGKADFQTVSIDFKLPGVIKLIPTVPKSMIMRIDVEHDVPKAGSAMAVFTTWDPAANAPKTGAMAMVRVVTVEPNADGTARMLNISCSPPFMPTWALSLFLSKHIMTGMVQATERYKQIKGI